jgi:transcriptional regulator with XRE-family HTH domain
VSPSTSAQLGAAIRKLRAAQGLSIEALAAKADVHWTSVSRIEHGEQSPTWDTVGRIAGALGLDVGDLDRRAAEQ